MAYTKQEREQGKVLGINEAIKEIAWDWRSLWGSRLTFQRTFIVELTLGVLLILSKKTQNTGLEKRLVYFFILW